MEVLVRKNPHSDRVKSALRLGLHLLVLISGVSLLLTQKLLISSSILLIATLFTLFTDPRPRKNSFWEVLSFLYLVYFFADWFWVTRSLAPSLVHLFIFIMINKLFNLHSDRDYYQVYLLTFLSMLAATALSVEIEMLYMIVLFLMLFVWNIMSITLTKTWSKLEEPEPFPFSLFSPRYWGFVVLSSLIMIGFALAIFFVLPRTQLGYFGGLKPGETQHVSGFSQKVQLGEIAKIQENRGEVMRIRVSGSLPANHRFYWRGVAFDLYDGKSWSTSNSATNFLFQDSSNTFYVSTEYNSESLIKQDVYLAPIESRVIFGQDRVIKVEGNFFGVTKDINGNLSGMGTPENYEVYSQIVTASPQSLRSRKISYSENMLRYYTKLPYRSRRIDKLAQDITTGATTVYDRVNLVKTYLEDHYQYTTTDIPIAARDPVYQFLFRKKAGHCEYFATAMVILLRHLGIPSRIVNGFLQGEYNEIGEFYIVRQSDAHSWVEVYFGKGMWSTFDPSPRSVASDSGGGSIWGLINPRKILESISFFWDRYILIFSAQDQINVLTSVRQKYQKLNDAFREKSKTATGPAAPWRMLWIRHRVPIILLFLFPVIIYYGLRLFSSYKRRLELIRSPVLFYQEMLLLLKQRGFVKPINVTPSEFALYIGNAMPALHPDVASLTDLFYRARFGNYSLTRDDQNHVDSALSRLRVGK